MAYTTAEGREQILDDLGSAIDRIAAAVALLGEAYEQLDEDHADQLEERLFRPVQAAYGRAQRTHLQFAARSGMRSRSFAPGLQPGPSHTARDLIESAADAAHDADQAIAELQDSLLPVEVGDTELRAGLSAVREALDPIPARARELVRVVGR
ncbi:MAG: hypothetical protein ACYCXW_15610 [Solirubrobacteraceae bacterium]